MKMISKLMNTVNSGRRNDVFICECKADGLADSYLLLTFCLYTVCLKWIVFMKVVIPPDGGTVKAD